jgi:hypothetical protein
MKKISDVTFDASVTILDNDAMQIGPTSDDNSIYYIKCGNQLHIMANQNGSDNFYTNLMLMAGTGSQTASVGVIGRGNDSRIYFTTSNATQMQLFSSGNLGIGVASDPSERLEVGGKINAIDGYQFNGTDGYNGTITITNADFSQINIDVEGGLITNVY